MNALPDAMGSPVGQSVPGCGAGRRPAMGILGVGLVALLFVALPAPADAGPGRTVLRGQTDQNQPLVLRLERSQRLLRFRFGLLVLSCRGRAAFNADQYRWPRATVVRIGHWLRYGRRGRLSTSYTTHRFNRIGSGEGWPSEAHVRSRVIFRAAVGVHGSASGTFRVLTRVRGREVKSEEAGYDHFRYRCDSGTRRWRVPRLHFSGPWRPTGPMLQPRSFGAVVPLRDGRVLLAGGDLVLGPASAAEIYDPGRNRWTRAARMIRSRAFASAVRLADGRVLVAGGEKSEALRSAEIYSPGRNRWSAARPMLVRRRRPSATLLHNGLVLVTGGDWNALLLNAELYDPAADRWTRVADSPLPGGLVASVAVALRSGRVMVVAAVGASSVYDPAWGAWTPPEPVPGVGEYDDWDFASVTLLRDGRVLLLGDCLPSGMRATAIYGPAGWSSGAPLDQPASGAAAGSCPYRSGVTATLPSGRVLVPGYDRAALYDPSSDSWTQAPSYFFPPNAFLLEREYIAPVPGGALLIGGLPLTRFSTAERFFEDP